MSPTSEKLTDSKQLLSACCWRVETRHDGGKVTYVVFDKRGAPRRSFIPVERLYDYARGVFDAQEF